MKNYIILIFLILSLLILSQQYDITGFGMPIMDYIYEATDNPEFAKEIRETLDYQMDDPKKSDKILSEIFSSNKSFSTVGGSTLNTIRAANKILGKSKNIFFTGSISNDLNGKKIEETLIKENIDYKLYYSDKQNTSNTIILAVNRDRKIFANMGCSKELNKDFLSKLENVWFNSKIFFTDLYLVGYSYDLYEYIFNLLYSKDDVKLGLSMAAWRILKDYSERLLKIFPLCDIFFMNKSEFKTLKKIYNYTLINNDVNDVEGFVKFLADRKLNKNKDLVITITRGLDDTIIASYNYQTKKLSVEYVQIVKHPLELDIDFTGLGDAYAGGFLAGIILNKSYKECAIIGHYLSSEVIQLIGFQVPNITLADVEKDIERYKREEKEGIIKTQETTIKEDL